MDRPRFTRRAFPHLGGDTVPVTGRLPRAVVERFDAAVARAEGIETRTDALEDAVVVWTMIEELEHPA